MRHWRPTAFRACPWLVPLALCATAGCASNVQDPDDLWGHPPGKHLLVTISDWAAVTADDDPYPPAELGTTDCPDHGWFEEDGALEIDTDVCAHVTLTQPGLVPIYAGDSIRLSMYHQNLWAPSPGGEAVVALRVGSEEVFTRTMAIPGPASPITHSFTAADSLPQGTPVVLHIRNHGTNAWYLYEISIETPP